MVVGTAALQAGRLDLETVVRASVVLIADPLAAASAPPVWRRWSDRPARARFSPSSPISGDGSPVRARIASRP